MSLKTSKINTLILGLAALLCLALITGCTAQSTIASSPTLTIPVSPNIPQTKQPSTSTIPAHPTPTQTQQPTTSTSLPQPDREFDAFTSCIPIEEQVSQDFTLNGGLFLYDPTRERSHDVVLMDLSSRSISEFAQTEQTLISLRTSPDGIWLAYIVVNKKNYNDEKLVVKNIATNSTLEIPWRKEWDISSLRRWLNDKELLITTLENSSYPPTFIALNPFTGESSTLPSTFPGQEVLSPLADVSPAEYDPSLNYVIYPAKKADKDGFSLFDRRANKQIAFFPSQTFVETKSPVWSHNGQKFVFVAKMIGSDSYINLGRPDGSVTHIINLSRQISAYTMRSLTWSPNDKFVIVDIYDANQDIEKLLLLDMDRQKLLDPCIKIEYDLWSGAYSDSNFPAWSPDSRYLIVEEQFDYRKNKVILIDVAQMQAGILAQDQMVLGWVSLAP